MTDDSEIHDRRAVRALMRRPERRAMAAAPPYAMSAAPSAPAPESDWQRYLRAMARHRWLVLAVTLLGTAAGFALTRFLDPRFAARATIWIEGGDRAEERGPLAADELLAPAGWIELVTSNAVLDSVVRDLRLYLLPRTRSDSAAFPAVRAGTLVRPGAYRLAVEADGVRYRLTDTDDALMERGTVGDSIGRALGLAWVPPAELLPPGRTVAFDLAAPYDVALQLGRALKVRLDPAGSFLRITLKGSDAPLTAATVNAVARRVVVVAADLKRRKFEELERILGGQLAHADSVLRDAEEALSRFRVRTAGMAGVPGPLVAPQVGDVAAGGGLESRVALDGLRRDREALEALLVRPPGGALVDALSTIAAAQRSPEMRQALQEVVSRRAELRALRGRYTEESAPVLRLAAEVDTLERRAIPAIAAGLVRTLAAEEQRLRPQVGAAIGRLRRVPPLALEETRLIRDVASAEELFTTVRQRHEAARLALVSSLPDLRILDVAVPPRRPAADFAPLVIILAFGLSFVGVVLGVTVFDQVDVRVRYPEQVTRGMQLTLLATVPHVELPPGAPSEEAMTEVIEALRGLRLRILHASDRRPVEVTVTSPAPGEGKSFVSVNLALAFAHAGLRTVLVDGDMRRGAQHLTFGLPGAPGLIDVLSARITAAEAIQRTSYPGLALISAGTPLEDAPELLLGDRLDPLLRHLRGHFDVIIVDSPPLAAGADALALGTATGELLLVLRAGSSDVRHARSRLEVVGELPVETLGAVLNGVRPGGEMRYYAYSDPAASSNSFGTAVGSVRRVLGGRA